MPRSSNFIYILVLLIALSSNCLQAQDAPMSQFYSNLVVLNPGFVGTTKSDRVNLFYRNQWLRSDAGFNSFGISYDKSFPKYNSGLGVILTNEMNGAFMKPTFYLVYSYMFEAAPGLFIGFGLQGGIVQKYMLSSDLVFEDELLTGSTSENIQGGFNKISPDFASGATAFYKNIYAGASVHHISQPYQGLSKSSNERLNRKYTAFFGYLIYYETRLKKEERVLSPNILVQIQGLQQNINWGFSFQYDKLIGGLWLRHNLQPNVDALIFSFGYKTQRYKFAYSYDMNVGKKTTMPLGAHEISFTTLFETQKKKKFKSIKCPTFLQ